MTLAAVVMGVAGIILTGGFVQDIFFQLGEATIHSQTGHLQIAKGEFFGSGSRRPEAFLIDKPEQLKKAIASDPSVTLTMGRLNFQGLLNNGRSDFGIVGEGIEANTEAKLGSFVAYIQGRALTDADQQGVTLGEGVAKALKLAPGDSVTLIANTPEGAMNTLDLEVIGVFRSFSKDYDGRTVRITLPAAQDLIGTPGVNVIVAGLKQTADTESSAARLESIAKQTGLELRRWTELSDFYFKTVDLYERQFGVLQLIVLVMVLLSVTNTVNMTVFERQGEFGTVRALGNRSRQVFVMVLTESLLLGLIGAVIGIALGSAIAALIGFIGIPMPPPPNSNVGYTAYIRIVPTIVLNAAFVGIAAAFIASLLPGWRVSRMLIVDALRHNV
ncbi:MAG TPA: FtsX-like permease family protein [Burkholderiales bacterium]|nr:FtsX-like permease family protein [Burkholderiales bacterium]